MTVLATIVLVPLAALKGEPMLVPVPPVLGRHKKLKRDTDYGGKTWVAGKAEPVSPRVAVSLEELP